MKKIFPYILAFVILFAPALLLAEVGLTPTSGGCPPGQLCNPLKVDSISKLVEFLLRLVVRVGGVIAVLMIIYSGFLFVKARGNSDELESAKKTLFNALIGTAILIGAELIATIMSNTINNVQRGIQ